MKADAVIKGHAPVRGDYLVHHDRVKTQGRVIKVKDFGVVWFSNDTGAAVRSDPDGLREDGWEWSNRPLIDYVVKREFPHVEQCPEVLPCNMVDKDHAETAALAHAEKGDTVRAAAIFNAIGNKEAADVCRKALPRWR